MSPQKKNSQKTTTTSFEEDDFYAAEKKRIAEEAQKAHKIHELEVQSHLTSMIPYYDECDGDDRRRLLLLNSLLINRFEEPGMMYWNIFRRAPTEIRDYADLFTPDLNNSDLVSLIHFLEGKKLEEENMVEMGFDEDGEEDSVVEKNISDEVAEEEELDDLDEEREEREND